MSGRIRSAAASAVLALGLLGTAVAGPLEDGEAAYHRSDYESAARVLRPLAEQGNATAEAYVGMMYLAGQGVPQDFVQGFALLTKSANQGLAAAQYAIGMAYARGVGVNFDPVAAAAWLRRAAGQDGEDGAADAQLQLSRLYRDGAGVPQDITESRRLATVAAETFEKSAARGDVRSQLVLASMYEQGEGVVRDTDKAASLYLTVADRYRKAADQGDPIAQFNLGRMYARGQGLAHKKSQAAIWYRRSADQGYAEAQLALSLLYMSSPFDDLLFGIADAREPEDEVQSYVWLRLAQRQLPQLALSGTGGAGQVVDPTRAGMTADQLAEADALIRNWRPVKEAPRQDGGDITMTPAQAAEAARLQSEWDPTPEQVDAAIASARSYDMALGSPDAKLTVVEYASVSSPHAAWFDMEVFPAYRAKYIDTGKVRFVFREFLTGNARLAAEGFLIARCAGKDRYFTALDAIFRQQTADYKQRDLREGLRRVALSTGMNDRQIDACISDAAARKALFTRFKTFSAYEHINGSPTFVIGDQVFMGRQSLAQLDAASARALGLPVPPVQETDPSLRRSIQYPHGLVMLAVDREAATDPKEAPPAPGDERVSQLEDGGDLWLRKGAVITADMIASATVDTDQLGRPSVSFSMTEEGRRRFESFTAANIGRQLAILWDGEVISTPWISEPITGGGGMISGNFTREFVRDLVYSIGKPKS